VFREEVSAAMMFDEMPHSNGEEGGGGAALGYGFLTIFLSLMLSPSSDNIGLTCFINWFLIALFFLLFTKSVYFFYSDFSLCLIFQ